MFASFFLLQIGGYNPVCQLKVYKNELSSVKEFYSSLLAGSIISNTAPAA
jgi:hypothetical protein